MNGLLRCARYALAPNKLKYCGPDKNQELAAYVQNKASDGGLKEMLDDFGAMYPYLKLISEQNGIFDPFDERVVEAYWLGNERLDKVSLKSLYSHWGNKVTVKERKWLELKLPRGAKPNHQFHVFNFINRTGHKAILHTVETMDNCRISYGEILQNDQFSIFNFQVKTNKLVYRDGRLKLVRTVKGAQSLEKGYKFGDLVT
ncbi:MAG: DUF6390 family protein, partial [Patescibacteria group bacterium]